jgi:hypothetical protein
MDFAIGLELQTTHPHRGGNVIAAATNSAPALALGCASCFEGALAPQTSELQYNYRGLKMSSLWAWAPLAALTPS